MRPLEIEIIRSSIAEFTNRQKKAGDFGKVYPQTPDSGLLRTKTANEWMQQEYSKPAARSLFGNLWFEHELCIMFADTNLGKSILAVQIADMLTKCGSLEPLYNEVAESLNVLYVDFELSAKQFEARYVNQRWGSYAFAPNFYRSEFNTSYEDPMLHDHYDEYIQTSISNAVSKTKAQVLIIDNITYMRNGTDQAKNALQLMKALKALKSKFNLSVLVLAHTPKRNPYQPLTVNDLQGSKMLINFADSAFAIGQSQTMPGMRYLKQIKQRNKQEQFGQNNICLLQHETHLNFLRYKFIGYANERDHICRPDTEDRALLNAEILKLSAKGNSNRQIASQLGLHHSTVARIIMRAEAKKR